MALLLQHPDCERFALSLMPFETGCEYPMSRDVGSTCHNTGGCDLLKVIWQLARAYEGDKHIICWSQVMKWKVKERRREGTASR